MWPNGCIWSGMIDRKGFLIIGVLISEDLVPQWPEMMYVLITLYRVSFQIVKENFPAERRQAFTTISHIRTLIALLQLHIFFHSPPQIFFTFRWWPHCAESLTDAVSKNRALGASATEDRCLQFDRLRGNKFVAWAHLRFVACPSLFPRCFVLFHDGLIKMHRLNLSSGHWNNYRSSSISRLTVKKQTWEGSGTFC